MFSLTSLTVCLLLLPLATGASQLEVVQGQSPQQFFQLVAEDDTCLQIWSDHGSFTKCRNTYSYGGFSPNTVFLLNGNTPGYLNIQIYGIAQCLDREHCHSSTSNLRYSECSHCGAIHWSINNDGSVREDSGKNCIYRDSSGQASVHHCSDGFEKFRRVLIGDHFLLKSTRHGDCVAGDKFVNCDCAPTFYTSGLPGNYQLHVSLDSSKCLDREHCHHSTSNVRLYDCTHYGAIHWSVAYVSPSVYKVGEDEMKNCVNRGTNNEVVMKHCSDGYESLYFDIIPNEPSTAVQSLDDAAVSLYPDPNPNDYLALDLSQRVRGARLFRYSDGTCELEIVHFLPYYRRFQDGQYTAEYMVTHIHTNIPYESFLTIEYVMSRIATDLSQITQYNIRYGMIDNYWQNFRGFDGLYSQFVTNPRGVPVYGYTANTINQLEQGLQHGTYNWNQYYENTYPGHNNPPQMHLDIFHGYSIAALYWSWNFYCGPQFEADTNIKENIL